MTSTTLQIPFIRGALSALFPAGKGANLSVLLFHKVPALPDALVPNDLCLPDFEHILDFLQANTRVRETEGSPECAKNA